MYLSQRGVALHKHLYLYAYYYTRQYICDAVPFQRLKSLLTGLK